MMKYSVNHFWKFKYVELAFLSGFLQVIACFFIGLVNYAVILQSDDVKDLAKDFVALMIIAEFDNMFATYSEEQITKDILEYHKNDYKDLFKIETTSSEDSKGPFNKKLETDKIWTEIKKRLAGEEQIRRMTPEITMIKSDQSRCGGFSPSQWVLGRNAARPDGDRFDEESYADLGILSSKLDPETVFAKQQGLRTAARKAYVKVDCGKRVARAVLRKSAPIINQYQVGALVSFPHKDPTTAENRWSTASRIIYFQGEKVGWLLTEGVPVCAALDKIRPCTPAESMAYLYMHTDGLPLVVFSASL